MLIGEDFDKIEFEFLGLNMQEPNTFIGDMLLFLFAAFFAYKLRKLRKTGAFFNYWYLFYIIFGLGFFLGGFGHLFYEYLGIPGKTPSWYLGFFSVYFIERAMISIHPNARLKKLLFKIGNAKLVLVLVAELAVSFFVDLEADYSRAMIIPTINSTLGLVLTLGVLGYFYAKKTPGLKFFWLSVLVQFPAAFFQIMKINIHPWFDKNDASHLLLLFGLFCYFAGIRNYQKSLQKD